MTEVERWQRSRVAALIRTLLEVAHPGRLQAACDDLYAALSAIAGVRAAEPGPDEAEDVHLATGTAIAPLDAARCVQDPLRTAFFMRGIRAACAEASQRLPGAPVEVLYAGCGPFAPLTLPLVLDPRPADVQITLIDAHPRALDTARAIYDRLGALACVGAFIATDAATYTADAWRRPHLVVCECMQRGLTKEPQVAITRNLAAQLEPGGILVPERITIDACLADQAAEYAQNHSGTATRNRIPLGHVATLSKETGGHLPPVVIDLPEVAPRQAIHLLTTIHVYGDLVLRDYDSGITFPLMVVHPAGAQAIEVRYESTGTPRWRITDAATRER